MKKNSKVSKNISQKVSIQKLQEIPEEQQKPKDKKTISFIMGGVLLAIIFLGVGWFLGHKEDNYNPYYELDSFHNSRHRFIVKSAEVSVKMADRAVEALKKKNLNEAIKDCKIAIDIFPIDAKPYILLTKLYLMTGQEQKMFDTLILAGRSYPNFNNILSVIDDENLDRIPLEEPREDVYLANFPENKKMALSFMFDDGESNVYKALPTFEKYGYRATIPVVAGFVADKSNDPFWGSWEEWKDAASRGFEIANHSMFHRDSKDLHGDDFDLAIDQAQDTIEKNIGKKVTAYVFPHDSYTDEAVGRALRKHLVVRTSEFLRQYYERTVDIVYGGPYVSLESANRLIDIGIKRRLWLIGKCHGVTEKRTMRSFKSITPEFLEEHLAYVHSKSDDVWVDTFSNIFGYLYRRAQTKIEIKDFSTSSADFILHTNNSGERLSSALTVMLKIPDGEKLLSAKSSDNQMLKAWTCDLDKLCIDVASYEQEVHVQWEGNG